MKKTKKGVIQLNQITPILITLLIAGFVIGIAVIASGELVTELGTNATHTLNPGALAVNNTIGAVFNLSSQLPLFGTIIGLFIILGIIFLLVRGNVRIGQ